jgi:hypothetical protein
MKYLMLINHSESHRSQPVPAGLMEAMGTFVTDGFKSGMLKDTAGLKATEAKEVVGGYALVEVKSKEEALEVARQFMELHRIHWPAFEGECEVRPLEDM